MSISFNNKELIIDGEKQEVIVRGEVISLTPIEFKILSAFTKSPGRAFSRLKLLEIIQVDNYFEGYERGIDVHIKNLRKKIEKDSKVPSYILTVFGVGYKFGGLPDV
jgi:DNA-binding response OmpR family regulator